MSEAEQYAPGTLIWIRSDDEVWRAAEVRSFFLFSRRLVHRTMHLSCVVPFLQVLSSGRGELIVKCEQTNEQLVINPTKDPIYLRSRDVYTAEGLVGLDDLTQLTHLHEPAVLHSLQMRFDTDKIYTLSLIHI